MTPKEMADWLHVNLPWYRDNAPEMTSIIAFLRSLPEPTTDGRRAYLADWIKDMSQNLPGPIREEIAELLLHTSPGHETIDARRVKAAKWVQDQIPGCQALHRESLEEIAALILHPPAPKAVIAEAMRKGFEIRDQDEHKIAVLEELEAAIAALPEDPAPTAPIPMVLPCPMCGAEHVDGGEWATTRHHKTHLCIACKHEWRPFEYPTIGVPPESVALPVGTTDPTDAEREELARWLEEVWFSQDEDRAARHRAAALLRSGGAYEGFTAERWCKDGMKMRARWLDEQARHAVTLSAGLAECEKGEQELYALRNSRDAVHNMAREQSRRAEKAEAEVARLRDLVVSPPNVGRGFRPAPTPPAPSKDDLGQWKKYAYEQRDALAAAVRALGEVKRQSAHELAELRERDNTLSLVMAERDVLQREERAYHRLYDELWGSAPSELRDKHVALRSVVDALRAEVAAWEEAHRKERAALDERTAECADLAKRLADALRERPRPVRAAKP